VDIDWLPFTVLGERGTDHQWLFHLLIAPLTLLGHDAAAVNAACAIAGAATAAAIVPILRRAGVPWAGLVAVTMMFAADILPARFIALRAQNIALVLILAMMFAIAWRRTAWVGVIAFLFTQSYHGAVIMGLLIACVLGAQAVRERRPQWSAITAVAIGVGAGLLLSPWFPRNAGYLVFHTVFKAGSTAPELVGTEWLPSTPRLLLMTCVAANGLLASGFAAWAWRRRRASAVPWGVDTMAAVAMTGIFLGMSIYAWRFIEYYAPFAVLSGALLWRDARAEPSGAGGVRPAFAYAMPTLLAAALAWGAHQGWNALEHTKRTPITAFRDMVAYAEAHDERPMIFNGRWPDFQSMVFWTNRARYVAGLDGHYLAFGDPARFAVWYSISRAGGPEAGNNAQRVARAFGARWVIVARAQTRVAQSFAEDPAARLVLADRDGWLFEVIATPP
jgi:hypothetical protein